ncbi:MAG: RHS repeat protein, partial [Kiritimatiellae bacterium]|nr:RHS repeat protein [Kiritimatiellia bacterium]
DTADGLSVVATVRGAEALRETSATYAYPDGRTAYVERNGKRAETYDYGVSGGLQWIVVYEGPEGTNSPVWRATVTDALGRTVRELRPGFGGAILATENTYNAAGQLLSSEEYTISAGTAPRAILALRSLREIETQSLALEGSLRSRTLYAYDDLGALVLTAQDADLDGEIDLSGPDVVVSNETSFVQIGSSWWRETSRHAFPDAGSAAPLRVSTALTRLSGLGGEEQTEFGTGVLAAETRAIDALGNVSSVRTYRDPATHREWTISESPGSVLPALALSVGGHAVTNRTETGVVSAREYDALGRPVAERRVPSAPGGRAAAKTYAYGADHRVSSVADASGAAIAYAYDALGRIVSATDALGGTVVLSYDSDGRLASRRGPAAYPADFGYDDWGRLVSLSTYRASNLARPGTTRWLRDDATGLVTNKLYADGLGPIYDYTSDGRLSRRIWARGVATDYAYDTQGRLVARTYSDSTPAVSLAYDRLGRVLSAAVDGVSTNRYAYDRFGLLTNEVQNGTAIARTWDALGRSTGYALVGAGGSGSAGILPAAVSCAYDDLGRLASVASGDDVFTYGHEPDSSLVVSVANDRGLVRTTSFEPGRDLVSGVENAFGGSVLSAFGIENDALGRRVSIMRSGEAFSSLSGARDAYGYDDASQVTGAVRRIGSMSVPGFGFQYVFDKIGNRIHARRTDAAGAWRNETYLRNALNQYTRRSENGTATVLGEADPAAAVTVNGAAARRIGRFFAGSATFANALRPLWAPLEIVATSTNETAAAETDAPETDGIAAGTSSATLYRYVPRSPERFEYDADGNLVSDARFEYAWDAENRLVAAIDRTAPTETSPT